MRKRMYKILIADDEYWTREKFRTMIPWEEYQLIFLEPAVDGEDVLKKMEAETPDILITDINMPFLNGVELLKAVRENYPRVIPFVVSGYDDFEYVRDTFLSGAINYLIKPVTKVDLVQALSKALQLISQREKQEEEDREQSLKIASLIQDREFSRLLEEGGQGFLPPVTVKNGVGLADSSLMLIKLHAYNRESTDRNWLSFRIKMDIRGLLGAEEPILFNHVYRSNEFLIISELEREELRRLAERIVIYFKRQLQAVVTVCITDRAYSMDSIHMAYVDAVGLLMLRKFCQKSEIVTPDKQTGGTDCVKSHLSKEMEKRMLGYLQSENKEALKKLIFTETGLKDWEEQGWTYLEVRQTLRQITGILSEYMNVPSSAVKAARTDGALDGMDNTAQRLDGNKILALLEEIIEDLFAEDRPEAEEGVKGSMRQAIRYVEEHFFEDITLVSLAEKFHVEPSYFSRMFRREAGESLISYLTGIRMEKAKAYMEDGTLNLTEIAYMAGYEDYTYFSRVFRKYTGMSPRDYRQRLGQKPDA